MNEDGSDGPVVDRVSVLIKDFVVGQERRSEEFVAEEKEQFKKATAGQIKDLKTKVMAPTMLLDFDDEFFGRAGATAHQSTSNTKTVAHLKQSMNSSCATLIGWGIPGGVGMHSNCVSLLLVSRQHTIAVAWVMVITLRTQWQS